jgi:hypothetical protein
MILYINGDSHSAAAEAVNPHCFAEDDGRLWYMGRAPHPDNARVSWGAQLAALAKLNLKLDAESASSNARIIRTTRDWFRENKHDNVLAVIQWSTWEREEWYIDGTWYQVNASGIDHVPESHQDRYKEYIASIDWMAKTHEAHEQIWLMHEWLNDMGVKHVFFNGNTTFEDVLNRYDWGSSYIDPYGDTTYNNWLLSQGFQTVTPTSYHFGADAHQAWARYLLKYIAQNKLI